MIVRKIRKIGSSYYVVVNKRYLKSLGINLGDYVIIALEDNKVTIRKLKIN